MLYVKSGVGAQLKSALELHDSRVDTLELCNGNATVHFSHAYIHKSQGTPGRDPGTGWSQEALLSLSGVAGYGPLPTLPNTISDGFLEVGGIKHTLLPLPFKRRIDAKLYLVFSDGARLEVIGTRPTVELLGQPIYLEDFE
jgi:hypothetical protein